MKDIISEYILTVCEIIAGLGIIYIMAKYAPLFMATIR